MKNLIVIIVIFIFGVIIGVVIQNRIIHQNNKPDINSVNIVEIKDRKKLTISKETLIDSLIKTGDTILYEKLRWQYDTSMYDFLGVAMIMANKYNYTNAYEDVFESFHSVLKSGNNFETEFNYSNFDKKTKKIAQEYLEEAVKRGNKNAIEMQCKYDKNCNYEKLLDTLLNKK